MWVRRQPPTTSSDFATEVIEIIDFEASLQVRTRIHAGRGVSLKYTWSPARPSSLPRKK